MLDTLKLNGVAHALLVNKDQQRFKVTGLGAVNLTDSITTHHRVYERQIGSMSHGYGYYTLGRLTDYRKDLSASPVAGYRFVFDSLDQLKATEYSSTSQQVCTPNADYGYRCGVTVDSTKTHTYDPVGNDTLAGSATYTTGNRLAIWSGSSYEHDLGGVSVAESQG